MRIATLEMPTYLGKDNKDAQEAFIRGYDTIDADIFIAPEYLWGAPVSQSKLDDILSNFDSEKIAIPGTIVNKQKEGTYNTAFVVSKEGVHHKYNKETTSQESEFIPNYVTGNNDSYAVDLLGKTFGIEICRDHGKSRLKKHVDSVDIHLVLANNQNLIPSKIIGKDYALLVDGRVDMPHSGLLKDNAWVDGKKNNNFTIYEI